MPVVCWSMMSNSRKSQQLQRFNVPARLAPRPGEGVVVETQFHSDVRDDGTAVTTISANLSSAMVPERHYQADIIDVIKTPFGVKLLFGQQKIGSDELRSLLVVDMSDGGVNRFLDTTKDMPSSFEEVSKKLHVAETTTMKILAEPPQTVSLAANALLVANVGFESCMDFYKMSAFSVLATQRGQNLAADPVVRVDLSYPLFYWMYRKMKELVPPEATP
jgi:hypothetical protein